MRLIKSFIKKSIKKKIKSINLLNDGVKPSKVAASVNYSLNTVISCRRNERKIREEARLLEEVEELKRGLRLRHENGKYRKLKEKQRILGDNHRVHRISVTEKLKCLDMLNEVGGSLNKVSHLTGHYCSTLNYWKKNEGKLRNEAVKIQLLKDIDDSESEIDYEAPNENVLRFLNYCKKALFTPMKVGLIFGFSKYKAQFYLSKESDIKEKLNAREKKRKRRLINLLYTNNHAEELRKLYILTESSCGLENLDNYLTNGVVIVNNNDPDKPLKSVKKRNARSISSKILPGTQQLFEELYAQEYELLYDIDGRYNLLMNQNNVYVTDNDQRRKAEVEDLQSHLQYSLERLILLHKMMCGECRDEKSPVYNQRMVHNPPGS